MKRGAGAFGDELALLPSMLVRILDARKATKKAMTETTDVHVKRILNGRQLALKVRFQAVV